MPAPATLRNGVATVAYWAAREIAEVWPRLELYQIGPALAEILPPIATTYGEASAALAADWYELDREEHGTPGRFSPVVVEIGRPDVGNTDGLARWAGGLAERPGADKAAIQTLVVGGTQRLIANAARYTIADSTIADPQAAGWFRASSGDACAFCKMLSDRGAVYSESSVNFGSHRACKCMAVPEWKNQRGRRVDQYRQTARNISAADRARTRAWIEENL